MHSGLALVKGSWVLVKYHKCQNQPQLVVVLPRGLARQHSPLCSRAHRLARLLSGGRGVMEKDAIGKGGCGGALLGDEGDDMVRAARTVSASVGWLR
jgi:hypothetical protein